MTAPLPSTAKARRPWTPEEKKLLGTAADVEIARRLGREEGAVYQMRRNLGIPATRHLKLWAKEEDRLLASC